MTTEIIVPIIVCSLIAAWMLFGWISSRYNKYLPLINVQATLINKRVDEWKNSPNSPWITEYYAEFDIGGERIELKVVKLKVYNELEIGKIGSLSYQLNKLYKLFIDFR